MRNAQPRLVWYEDGQRHEVGLEAEDSACCEPSERGGDGRFTRLGALKVISKVVTLIFVIAKVIAWIRD